MRGKAVIASSNPKYGRITPAYAGKSKLTFAAADMAEDHPRLCGEKPLLKEWSDTTLGSPPPMRGKVSFSSSFNPISRITPAYAGKRDIPRDRIRRNEDHPRLCGEKETPERTMKLVQGSPPPMRGKVPVCTGTGSAQGITPAYAGKSDRLTDCRDDLGDHPRLCGEKSQIIEDRYPVKGSPPPMRGKDTLSIRSVTPHWITPAYAGKSGVCRFSVTTVWDHPRLCGEKLKPRRRIETNQGSPPPMRGKAEFQLVFGDTVRITPAYAGKRSGFPAVEFYVEDHPRLCGEKLSVGLCSDKMTGSPPPMRGKDTERSIIRNPPGITPAYAGKSTTSRKFVSTD